MVSIPSVEDGATSPAVGSIRALGDGDLFGLRLAGQVLGHKSALAGRPRVARWFADLESFVGAELARRGVGVVLVVEPELRLAPDADATDRQLLGDYLRLLAANESLSETQRAYCRALLEGLAS
ncbi:hypothetical protein BH23CHL7_BH23CHL7_18120 [soil metagenome]